MRITEEQMIADYSQIPYDKIGDNSVTEIIGFMVEPKAIHQIVRKDVISVLIDGVSELLSPTIQVLKIAKMVNGVYEPY